MNIELTSDDTYLRRYKITSNDTLKNHVFLEGFRGRNYAAANAYNFRGLREADDSDTTPLVVPLLDYNFIGRPGARGSPNEKFPSISKNVWCRGVRPTISRSLCLPDTRRHF